MVWSLIFLAAVFAVLYLLYRQGMVVSKCIAAIVFVFRPQDGQDRAALDSCTGWVRHAVRLRESRPYEFTLGAQLSKGDAEVVLLDRKKRQLLKIDRQSPSQRIDLDGKNRYYLCWGFKNATGTCELRWE